MWKFIRSRVDSFKPAFEGLQHVLRTQPNAWVHALISIAVIALGVWLGLDINSWAVIILIMALVWVAEFANTAIEAVVDVVSPDHHPLAKIAKDVSAAAVIIAALAAVIIGLLILGPRLWERLSLLISPN
jgi:diacylglycerol kinase